MRTEQRYGEYQEFYGPPVLGTAEQIGDDEPEYPAAILYLPDPAERRGILTRWVKRRKPEAKPRQAGFRP